MMHSTYTLALDTDTTPMYKRRIAALIDGTRFTLFMTAVTLWTLFGDDIRLVAFTQEDDRIFVYIVYACFFLFALEMMLACIAKRDYPFGFFFWLDTYHGHDVPPRGYTRVHGGHRFPRVLQRR